MKTRHATCRWSLLFGTDVRFVCLQRNHTHSAIHGELFTSPTRKRGTIRERRYFWSLAYASGYFLVDDFL